MVPNLQQSSHLPSCAFHSHHQTHWPPLFFYFLTFSFFPNCLWPQIPSLLLQLFASIKPLYRYLSSLLHQHGSPPGKPYGRYASNKFVFLRSDWHFSASVRCSYEPWYLWVPPEVFCTTPAPAPPPARRSPVQSPSSPDLPPTHDWTSGGPCLGPAQHFNLLLSSCPSLDLLCWPFSPSLFPERPYWQGGTWWEDGGGRSEEVFAFVPVLLSFTQGWLSFPFTASCKLKPLL